MLMKRGISKRLRASMLAFAYMVGGILLHCGAAEPGSFKVTGLIQNWYVNDGKPGARNGLSVRRAEIKLSGQAHPRASWFIMLDPAKPLNIRTAAQGGTLIAAQADPKSMILKDVGVVLSGWERFPQASFQVGQFKPPFGMEGSASSSELDLVARASLSEVLGWSDYRDLGAMIKYQQGAWNAFLGVFNGEGPNTPDVNNDKDIAARVIFTPAGSLHIGLSGYHGRGKVDRYLSERAGAEFSWLPDPWFFKAELAAGHGATSTSSSPAMRTAYALAGWKFKPKLQGVARFDWWDTDTAAGQDIQNETTIGLNYLVDGHKVKVQVNYVLHNQAGPAKPYSVVRTALQLML